MARSKVPWGVAALMLGLAALALAAEDSSTEKEEENGLEIGATADVFSQYIWRGQNVLDNWVLQPGASIGYKGLTGSIWGNMDLAGETVGSGSLSEVDFTLDYSNKVPGLDVLAYSLGVIHYDYVNTSSPATSEVYGGLNLGVPLSPAVRWYYDFEQIDGSYIQFSIGHTIEKVHKWADNCYCDLQLGASVGYGSDSYNRGYFGVDEGAFNDLTLTAGLPICLGKLTIKPNLGYSMMLDKDIRTGAAPHADNFWGGVSLAYSFN